MEQTLKGQSPDSSSDWYCHTQLSPSTPPPVWLQYSQESSEARLSQKEKKKNSEICMELQKTQIVKQS